MYNLLHQNLHNWIEPDAMPYKDWCVKIGQYRWYDEEGRARTFVDLDYEWATIFNIITANTDYVFENYIIEDIDYFTRHFIDTVPVAWLKFKTELEMFLGTLDGTNINPQEFKAGFERWTNHNLGRGARQVQERTATNNMTTDSNGSGSQNIGLQAATSKSRGIAYNQGVQAYNNQIDNDNIGELGNDYASGMNDTVSVSNVQPRSDTNTSTNHSETDQNANNTDVLNNQSAEVFGEHIREERINYYDQLAFLRERFDRINRFDSFQRYFLPLFTCVEGMGVAW